jgi:hypothetical protein
MNRPNKYRNTPVVVDGIRFASKAEAKRYGELRLLDRAGIVRGLKLQPEYRLDIDGEHFGTYIGDFYYEEKADDLVSDWKRVVEDVKGVHTPVFRLKWRLVKALYPTIEFRLIPAARTRRAAA